MKENIYDVEEGDIRKGQYQRYKSDVIPNISLGRSESMMHFPLSKYKSKEVSNKKRKRKSDCFEEVKCVFHLKRKTHVIDEDLKKWVTSSAKNIFSKHPTEDLNENILPKLQMNHHYHISASINNNNIMMNSKASFPMTLKKGSSDEQFVNKKLGKSLNDNIKGNYLANIPKISSENRKNSNYIETNETIFATPINTIQKLKESSENNNHLSWNFTYKNLRKKESLTSHLYNKFHYGILQHDNDNPMNYFKKEKAKYYLKKSDHDKDN